MKLPFYGLKKDTNKEDAITDIVIIGGGITGVGIARDAALRGFKVTVLEQSEIGSGTSGHFHGLLHSGARYVVDDPATGKECYDESQLLHKIAPSAVEDTGGLFVALNQSEVRYGDKLLTACAKAGIPAADISLAAARRREPSLSSPYMRRVITVPDGAVNGTELLQLNRASAEAAKVPATFLTHQKVIKIKRRNGKVVAVVARDMRTNKKHTIQCRYLINAAGVWSGKVGKLAGVTIKLVMDKGTMVVLEKRLAKAVINRCRPADDGDLIVANDNYSVLGTTSIRTKKIDNPQATEAEISQLIRQGEALVPSVAQTDVKEAYAGIRPLFSGNARFIDSDIDARTVSRSFAIIDHAGDVGIDNFISVVGGKVTIYRRMAEDAVDLICKKDGVSVPCRTAQITMMPAPKKYSVQNVSAKL